MNLIKNLIFLILFFTIINANHVEKSINSGYKRMLKRVKSDLKDSILNVNNILIQDENHFNFKSIDGNDDHHHQHLPGYNCIHDVIANDMGIKKEENFKENSKLLQSQENFLKSTQATVGPLDTLRFHVDTSFLFGDLDVASCKTVGQIVKIGGSKNTGLQPCNGLSSTCAYTCKQSDILSEDLANLIKDDIVATIQDTLGPMLLVNRTVGNFILPISNARNTKICDYDYSIPDSYFNEGVPDADIVVLVTARPVYSTSTIAYAAPCIYINGQRPYAATINFNPRYFTPFISKTSQPSQFIFNEYVRVGIHEMTHGLGFTSQFFPFYKMWNGTSYKPQAGSSVSVIGATGSGVGFKYVRPAISTPSVASFVKEHYQCSDSSKAYQLLEDYGSSGTAGSHWEKRTVGEEYMLGYVSPVFPVTALTLSLFEDMGWYQVDKSLAEPLMWGKGLGCDWLNNCDKKGWNYPGYFCEDPNTISCSPTRVGKGRCNIQTNWKNLDLPYQHFPDETEVGDIIADGCPFYDVEDTYCVDSSNSDIADSSIGEYYGDDSRCFEYTDSLNSLNKNLACWKYECRNDVNLFINVNNNWVDCSTPGKTYIVGSVTMSCPEYFYPCKNPTYQSFSNSSTLNYPGITVVGSSSKLIYSNLLILLLILISIVLI